MHLIQIIVVDMVAGDDCSPYVLPSAASGMHLEGRMERRDCSPDSPHFAQLVDQLYSQ